MSQNPPPQNTFVVRFWWELPDDQSERSRPWSGRIEHLQSGDQAAFHDVAELVTFMARYVACLPADPA